MRQTLSGQSGWEWVSEQVVIWCLVRGKDKWLFWRVKPVTALLLTTLRHPCCYLMCNLVHVLLGIEFGSMKCSGMSLLHSLKESEHTRSRYRILGTSLMLFFTTALCSMRTFSHPVQVWRSFQAHNKLIFKSCWRFLNHSNLLHFWDLGQWTCVGRFFK